MLCLLTYFIVLLHNLLTSFLSQVIHRRRMSAILDDRGYCNERIFGSVRLAPHHILPKTYKISEKETEFIPEVTFSNENHVQISTSIVGRDFVNRLMKSAFEISYLNNCKARDGFLTPQSLHSSMHYSSSE